MGNQVIFYLKHYLIGMKMTVLVCVTGRNNEKLIIELSRQLPQVNIQEWPYCDSLDEVDFVLAWNAPNELWSQLPKLKVIQSYGAGVDSIDLKAIPEQVQVTRIVDPQLAEDMAEHVLGHILAHKLRIIEYVNNQQTPIWKLRRARHCEHIGILGMGELAQKVVSSLLNNNFKVSAWSRTEKQREGISHYHGKAQLNPFLTDLDVLVCLLPLTDETKHILNMQLFKQLPDHSFVINVARGEHLNEQDLLTALAQGQISGAALDVFSQEPLPKEHSFWQNPKIVLTPHCAALTQIKTVCEQIADNVRAQQNNKPLKNLVCKKRGY